MPMAVYECVVVFSLHIIMFVNSIFFLGGSGVQRFWAHAMLLYSYAYTLNIEFAQHAIHTLFSAPSDETTRT